MKNQIPSAKNSGIETILILKAGEGGGCEGKLISLCLKTLFSEIPAFIAFKRILSPNIGTVLLMTIVLSSLSSHTLPIEYPTAFLNSLETIQQIQVL